MFKKIFGIFGMLLLLASFVAAAPAIMVSNLNPGADENVTCYVDGSDAGFDFYWYKGQTRLVSAGNVKSLVLPASVTEPATTYTCKVFRPSSSYVPEILIGSVSVTTKDNYVPPKTQCSDGKDNDGDNKIDMLDPGCKNPQDDDETNIPRWTIDPFEPIIPFHFAECSDRSDNDGDGKVDMQDPGCSSPSDDDEYNIPLIPFKPFKPIIPFHLPECMDTKDNDGDGKIDMQDPGCENPSDDDERNSPEPVLPQCKDGKDNDGDNKIDMLDPGCSSPSDDDETDTPVLPECKDGKDNDNDGKIDMQDPGCESPSDDDETNGSNGGDAEAPKIEIDDAILEVKDGRLKVSVVVLNSGDGVAKNVEVLYSVSKLGKAEFEGVGTIEARQHEDLLRFIDLSGVDAGEYTLMVEAYDDKGHSDVIYRTFEVAEDKLVSDVLVTYNLNQDNVEPAAPLGFFARVVKWFADLFALIWG